MKELRIYQVVKVSRKKHWKLYLLSLVLIFLFFYLRIESNYKYLLLIIAILIIPFIELSATSNKLYITSKGLKKEEGIFNKKYMDVDYINILKTTVKKSLMGRIFNFGNLEINVTSKGQAGISINKISDPIETQKVVDSLVEIAKRKK